MRSLRTRIVIGTILASAVMLISTAGLGYVLMRASLLDEFDTTLAAQAHALSSFVERIGDHVMVEYDADLMPEYARPENPDGFCFWDADGVPLLASPSLTGVKLERPRPPALGALVYHDGFMPDGRPARFAGITFLPRVFGAEDPKRIVRPLSLLTGRDTISRDQRLAMLAGTLGASALIGTCASALALWWLSGRLLRPLLDLSARIATIQPDGLRTGWVGPGIPREIAPVVERLDDLLGRLQAAFQRERSFTADAAHELRTPISGLRATLEVALTRPREVADYQEILGECLDISTQMQALVDNLLSLARLEAGQLPLSREPTPIATLVNTCWQPFAARAKQRDLHVLFDLNRAGTVVVDRSKLRLVLTNLFDNAVGYCNAGGEVAITAVCGDRDLMIEVVNSGCTLSEADAERVFDRFWRADSSRAASGIHCGLGLALCRKLMEAQKCAISASARGGRFRVRLWLPRGMT